MTSTSSFSRWLAAILATGGVFAVQAADPPAATVAPAAGEAVAEAPAPEAIAAPAPAAAPAVEAVPAAAVEALPAAVEAARPDPVEVTNAEPETVVMPGFSGPGESQERISIALDDVPLQDVVRMFTRISGANIIATSTNLGGKVTVNLQDVEWKPALGAILDMYSLQISEKTPASGIYSVMPKAPGAEDPLMASTIFLNYASVSNVAALVAPLLGKGGSVSPFPNCNALVIRSTAASVNEIRKVITEIDLPRKQVYIEAKFMELNDDAIKDLGINWQVLQGYGVGVGGMQWAVQEDRTKLKSRSDTLTRRDERSRNDVVNQAFDANGKPVAAGTTRDAVDTINQSAIAERALQDSFDKSLTDVRTAVLSASDFQVILSALKQQSGVSVVSNPKIIVANEQTATIHIGENEPNIKGTVTAGQQGQANTTTYELDTIKPYFEFGIKLDVTPVINNSSNITITINPTLSRFVRNKVAPDNNSFPVESTKTISTTFSLESGKTAAIGGLTETDDRKEEVKIPLLGDIPLIGKYLFTHTHNARLQQETIIFVTVGIANPQAINRDAGLPEDAELVHRHMTKRARTALGAPAVEPAPAGAQ